MSKTARISVLIAVTTVAGCSTRPQPDARSYQAGYHQGADRAMNMVRSGVSPVTACKEMAEAANGWNPSPYNPLDYEAGCERRLRDLGLWSGRSIDR
ncbi:Lipoprotein [Mycobacterium simiae]